MKLDHLLSPHTRINSKWIKDLNIRLQTIKILEETIGSKISDSAHSNILSDISPQARETKENNKQMGLHQTKKICIVEENINKINRQPTECENIFAKTSDGLISKIYKEITKFDTKRSQSN